jgi:membrane-associated protease RseP (regulator of RpoE activity)
MDWLYVFSVVVFVIALIIILFIDRKNIKRESIIILRKTQKGKRLLKRIGSRFPRGWKFLGMIGVLVTFCASVYGLYFLLNIVFTAMVTEEVVAGLSFVLPSPTPDVVVLPGVFAIPFWHLIISLALLIVVHEGSHGLMAVREKVPIKSLGWGFLLVLPLAFVEPDEKILAKRGNWPQLRVFAAGSFANFIVAGIVLLISFPLLSGIFTASGVGFVGYDEGYPAQGVNLTGIIVEINGQAVKNTGELTLIMDRVSPGETIEIVTKDYDNERNVVLKTYNLTTVERLDEEGNPTGKAYMGIRGVLDGDQISSFLPPVYFFINPDFVMFFTFNEGLEAYSGVILFFLSLLAFIFIINFGVGLVNMLPIKPLDGGRMWDIVFKHFFPGHSEKIVRTLSMITLFILIAAFIFPYVF